MADIKKFKVGDKAEIRHVITAQDIERFISLTGDDNKLHFDEKFAGKTAFKKPVAHGMLSAAFISTIIGTKLPGDGALWYSQSLEFLLPVRVGDEILVTAEIIGIIEHAETVELQTEIYNQHKQKVITGKAKVKVVPEVTPAEQPVDNTTTDTKVALVIGATGGIGSEVAKKLSKLGYAVAVHYNSNHAKALELVNHIREAETEAFAFQASLTEFDAVKNLVEEVEHRMGGISLVVNCAAIRIPGIKLENLVWSDFEEQLNVHLQVNFALAKCVVTGMKARKAGKIIFLTSQVVDGAPPAAWTTYTVAKHALTGFARSIAVELAAHNIKVNIVSPGMTETELIADIPEKNRLLIAAKAPLKRLAAAKDVAGAIGFLASADADYLTGETLRVNGGQVML